MKYKVFEVSEHTYRVYGNVVTPFSYEVEADSIDEAKEIVQETELDKLDYDDWATMVDITDVEEDD
jgi:hypothetical protein